MRTIFFLIALASASPIPREHDRREFSPPKVISWLCDHPVVSKICSTVGSIIGAPTGTRLITTPRGPVSAAVLANAIRATVPYAKPPTGSLRFADPVSTSWSSTLDGTKTPSPCPQNADPNVNSVNEDCLALTIYAPKSATGSSKLPVFVWIHGGSDIVGSSTAPGLNGTALTAQNILVVLLQYRLGSLGNTYAPSLGINGNQAVKDIVLALQTIHSDIASYGGDPSAVTYVAAYGLSNARRLAGQSSGGSLVATMLATPSADSLFSRAIIQSAPLDYADQSSSTAQAVGSSFFSALNCTTLACARSASVSSILSTQSSVFANAPQTIPGVSASMPIRPFVDGSLIRGNLITLVASQSGGLSNKQRPIIISTVQAEAAPTIDAIAGGQPLPQEAFAPIIDAIAAPQVRATALENSGLYTPGSGSFAVNDALTALGTDGVWRCPSLEIGLNATLHRQSSAVYLAEIDVGQNYVDNQQAYCAKRVCHEGDIYETFGTSPSPTSAQVAAQAEHVARWVGFVKSGSPNAANLPTWSSAQSASQLNVLQLGSPSSFAQAMPAACQLWGTPTTPFDAQLFGP